MTITTTSDVNIHFKRAREVNARKAIAILPTFGLAQRDTLPTNEQDGCLDVIISSADHSPEDVTIDYADVSEHSSSRESVVDLDTKAERFNSVISSLLYELASVKKVIQRERSREPWCDSDFRAARSKARWLDEIL